MIYGEYFRLATTVVLVMGITYENILLFHGISEQNRDNKIKIIDYNYSKLYEWLKNTYAFDCDIPDYNLPCP